jgi:hypothetical protein
MMNIDEEVNQEEHNKRKAHGTERERTASEKPS